VPRGSHHISPLWSPVVATGGNRSQIAQPREPWKQAETVAVGCDRLRRRAHGKEGVSGSSPEEGFAKAPQTVAFFARRDCKVSSLLMDGALSGALRFSTSRSKASKRPFPSPRVRGSVRGRACADLQSLTAGAASPSLNRAV